MSSFGYSSSTSLTSCSTADSTTVVEHGIFNLTPRPSAVVTLSCVHGKSFAKRYGLSQVSKRQTTRMYANADMEYIRPAIQILVESHGWIVCASSDGLLYDVASPAYATGYGGVRVQLPSYTSDGHILFSDASNDASIKLASRCHQDEQTVADNYASLCPTLAQLLTVLHFVFPGHLVALHAADHLKITLVMQLMPGPLVTEWMKDSARREELERILCVDDEERSYVIAMRRYQEVSGVLLKAQGHVPGKSG